MYHGLASQYNDDTRAANPLHVRPVTEVVYMAKSRNNPVGGSPKRTPAKVVRQRLHATHALENGAAPGAPPHAPVRKSYRGSIWSSPLLNPAFGQAVRMMEDVLDMPVWCLVQNTTDPDFKRISLKVYRGFQSLLCTSNVEKVALLIDSPGGDPAAFRLARLFQRRGISFTAVIPDYAKSAATLLALGASEIILGRDAELGPLDMQEFDPEREQMDSALNAVQALDRLNAFGLMAVDQTMQFLLRRIPKRTDVLLPHVLNHVAGLLKPMLEKIDAVEYVRKSRSLKVAEDYAARLMRTRYGIKKGRDIARRIIENYSDHGFVVDRDEVCADSDGSGFGLGIEATHAAPELQILLDALTPMLDATTLIGRLEEVPHA